MRIDFPYYRHIPPFEVPDMNLIGVFQPEKIKVLETPEDIISWAFENPVGSPSIRDLASGSKSALIITDDNTRLTPVKDILPHILRELESAGIPQQNIRIMVALGTHRPMTEAEKIAKYGKENLLNPNIIEHQWRDEGQLVNLGVTEAGTPIRVNKAVREADFIIGIGQIVPHRIAGFSGGGKIIQPGISGRETTAQTHWRSALYPGREILGVADNPVRLEIERVAKQAGLAAIVNAVCDPDGQLISLYVGDPVQAHREGAKLASKVFGVEIPEPADILIIDSYPMDGELWQGAKALYAGELAVKKDGVAILVSPCHEGVSRTHDLILTEGYRHSWETISMVEAGLIKDKIVAAHLVRVGRVIRDNGIGILVSPGISRPDTEQLGFRYAETVQKALDMSLNIKGSGASISVVRQGGNALPIVKSQDNSIG